jgi:D-serine deaminase-like pyridoxal phosphate-dependent protein
VARIARDLGLRVVGALGYPGQGYAPGSQAEAAAAERQLLGRAAVSLERGGFPVHHLSAGSTPTMPHVKTGHATEFRPGTYVFGDVQQVTLSALALGDVALTIVATVIAQRDGQVVLDCGAKILGRDRPPWLDGHGWLLAERPHLVSKLYDHHAVVEQVSGEPSFEIGSRVRVIPNNVNSAMALTDCAWSTTEHVGELRALRPLRG